MFAMLSDSAITLVHSAAAMASVASHYFAVHSPSNFDLARGAMEHVSVFAQVTGHTARHGADMVAALPQAGTGLDVTGEWPTIVTPVTPASGV